MRAHNRETVIGELGSVFIRSAALTILLVCSFCGEAGADDESREPALDYSLKIDGQVYPARIGEKIALKGIFTDPIIVIGASDKRRFAFGGISFDYPAYFTWEAEIEGAHYKNWTLSGRDFKIMYFRMSNPFSPEAYAAGMLKRFEGTPLRDVERKFGGIAIKGKSFSVKSGGHSIRNEALALPVAEGSALLVLQDSSEAGISEEGSKTLSMIERSFSVSDRR
jgi:hypothetical protein